MAVVQGTNLQNISDVIDAIRSELVSNHNWQEIVNIGTVGANSKEVWLHLPAALTKNGQPITVGLKAFNSDIIYINPTALTPADAGLTSSPRNTFLRVLGTPNQDSQPSGNAGQSYRSTTLTTSIDANPAAANLFNQGANYLNHFILTPTQVSPQGSKEQYCYCFVEVASGVWRTIAFGEVKKIGGSGWTGGVFAEGSFHSTSVAPTNPSSGNQHYPFSAGGDYHSSSGSGANEPKRSGWVFFENSYVWNATTKWNPWAWLGDRNGFSGTLVASCIGMDPRRIGRGIIQLSPSVFSGLTQRIPARLYITLADTGATPLNIRPFAEFPDVFLTNLTNFIPGDVVEDAGEKYLVVPYTAKSGANTSGNFGLLVRNADLAV